MKEDRWPKIYLKEELRNWKNKNESRWCREVELALRKVGDGETLELMRVAEDLQALPERMEIGCRVLIDQTIQDDWCIDKSTYYPEYRRRKDTVGLERYWKQNGVNGSDKEQWSRMRCGNVAKAGNKGYKDKQCK